MIITQLTSQSRIMVIWTIINEAENEHGAEWYCFKNTFLISPPARDSEAEIVNIGRCMICYIDFIQLSNVYISSAEKISKKE